MNGNGDNVLGVYICICICMEDINRQPCNTGAHGIDLMGLHNDRV